MKCLKNLQKAEWSGNSKIRKRERDCQYHDDNDSDRYLRSLMRTSVKKRVAFSVQFERAYLMLHLLSHYFVSLHQVLVRGIQEPKTGYLFPF